MSQNLKLEVLLAAINKATGPLKQITKSSNETAKGLKAARDRLRELNDQQKNIDGFRKLDKDIAITANSLNAATLRIKTLKTEMAGVEKPTATMNREFNRAVKEAQGLKQKHTELIGKQQELRNALNSSGMDTQKLATHQRTLKTELANATTQVNTQTEALKRQSEIASRIHQAQRVRDEALQKRNQIASAGAQTLATGVAMGLPILKSIKDFKEFESAMVGVAKQMEGARDANGKLTPTYYEMADAIKDMSERLPLTALDIARLVEGSARMGIAGKNNLLTFTEQVAIMASAFDLPTDQIAEDMGMMRGLYKIPIESIHELGDAINWLDDNAQSQGGDIINVMKRIAGTAGMVNMSYRDAAALGSTFLSLGAGAEVASTATNAMITRLANAPILSTAKRYAEGLKMLNLQAADLQQNMTLDATGTILNVLDRIKALPNNKQLEAATRLFGIEYGDDASKLAQNLEEYRRQLALTKDAQAQGSMKRESDARNDSLDSQATMSLSGITNASSEIGKQLKPALVEILGMIKNVANATRDWIKENPVLAGLLVKIAATVAVITIGIGALQVAVAAVMGPLIIMRYMFSMLGIKGSLLANVVRGAAIAFRFLGTVLLTIGRLLLLNPIGLAVTAIATSVFLIYKYWEPIKAWFSKLWDGITDRFNKFIKPIKEALQSVANIFMPNGPSPVLANGHTKHHITNRNNGNAPLIRKTDPIKQRISAPVQHINNAPVINVTAAPGMNEQQVAKMVAKEIENSNHQSAARGRSMLRDRN